MVRRGVVLVFLLVLATFYTLSPSLFAKDNSFVFTAVGDFGGTADTDDVLNGIAASGSQFHLALGDLSYGSYAPETAWCNYVKSKVGATFPFELVAGNHEMDGSTEGHIDNFAACLPDRIGNLTGTYSKEYYFDYQNLARFIIVSPDLRLNGQTYTYTVGSARYNWLANTIDSARAAKLPWVIVAMHKTCISVGATTCEIGTDLFNLLVSKKVDLVLQGHDHNYQRTHQLALNANCIGIVPNAYHASCVHDNGVDQKHPKGEGMVLVIAGTGGASVSAGNPGDSEANYFARFVHPSNDIPRHGFLKVNVTATQLSGQFVGTSGGSNFFDAFTISSPPPPSPTSTPPSPTAISPSSTPIPPSPTAILPSSTPIPPSPTSTTVPPTPIATAPPQTITLVEKNSTWKYLDNGSDQGTAWRAAGFDDTTWASGAGQLGYGDGDEAITIGYGPDPNNKYVTTYFRKTFEVANPAGFTTLTLRLLRDDGAVVYLNGLQIAKSNMPTDFAYDTYASTVVSGAEESVYTTFQVSPVVFKGTNVLAVQVHQSSATSSDLSFDLELVGNTAITNPTLAAVDGKITPGGYARVRWATASETSVFGFNVWRSLRKRGVWEKITPQMIAAKHPGTPGKGRYRLTDPTVVPGRKYLYRVEILHTDQSVEWSNPIKLKIP